MRKICVCEYKTIITEKRDSKFEREQGGLQESGGRKQKGKWCKCVIIMINKSKKRRLAI